MGLFDKIMKKKARCEQVGHNYVNGRCSRCGEVKVQRALTFSDNYWNYTLTFVAPQDKWIYCNTCHGYMPMLHIDCKGLKPDVPANPKKGVIYSEPEKSWSACLIHEDSCFCPNCDVFVLADESKDENGKMFMACKICGGRVVVHKGEAPRK